MTELAHYKDKIRALEAALQKKQTTTAASIPNKQLERRKEVTTSIAEPLIRGASHDEKVERLVKAQKSQNEIQMEQFAKENIKDFYDMALLEEDTKNYSIKGSEEKQKPKKETPEQKNSG